MADEGAALRQEMSTQSGDLSTRMGVLHEDVISRFALLHLP